MKVTLKYDQGIKANEVVELEASDQEFEVMIENDYRQRLANASEDEVIERRTPQEILDELNRGEYNNWRRHHRYIDESPTFYEDDQVDGLDAIDMVPDYSQMEATQRNEDYEEQCQKIRDVLKADHANMVIAICLDGMRIKEYAEEINDVPNLVTQRLRTAKRILRERLPKNQ